MAKAKKRRTEPVSLPMLPLRGLMVFPHMVLHFDVGRKKSIAALEQAMMADQKIFLVAQREIDVDDPGIDDIYHVGTIASIKQVLKLPGDNIRVLVEGRNRAILRAVFCRCAGYADSTGHCGVDRDGRAAAHSAQLF